MRAFFESARRLVHLALLRSASLLVPAAQRAEWRREWRGELWHVCQACAPTGRASWQGEREVTAFCLGAFQDALCLRRATRAASPFFAGMEGTRRQCLLILGAVLAASYAVALLLPGVRAERSLWPRKVNPDLVLIQLAAADDGSRPTISPRLFRSWHSRSQRFFDGFAFYRVLQEEAMPEKVAQVKVMQDKAGQETAETEPGTIQPQGRPAWRVARASANLFTLLGLSIEFADPQSQAGDDLPAVILSEKTWKRDFGASPRVAGLVVHLGHSAVRIAGVAPDGSLGLPGKVDAWLLAPDPAAGSTNEGFVVAHLTAAGRAEMWSQSVHISASSADNSDEDFLGVALEEWKPTTRNIYLFALLLALLALPAITSVSLGEYSTSPQKTSWSRRLHRWSFLCAKVALLLPIVYFISLNLAYGCTWFGREASVYIQLVSTFAMCLFGFRWVLKDQRQRCPVCVRRVTHPAQVGQASRTFLDWNGTEMICMGGHTLLHVPSLPTSWFGTQRWLYLDTSWGFLFAGSTRPSP
jgi:hypothetical protein